MNISGKVTSVEKKLIKAYMAYILEHSTGGFDKSDAKYLENDMRKIFDNGYCDHRTAVENYIETLIG